MKLAIILQDAGDAWAALGPDSKAQDALGIYADRVGDVVELIDNVEALADWPAEKAKGKLAEILLPICKRSFEWHHQHQV
jgi:hypothetical protein